MGGRKNEGVSIAVRETQHFRKLEIPKEGTPVTGNAPPVHTPTKPTLGKKELWMVDQRLTRVRPVPDQCPSSGQPVANLLKERCGDVAGQPVVNQWSTSVNQRPKLLKSVLVTSLVNQWSTSGQPMVHPFWAQA